MHFMFLKSHWISTLLVCIILAHVCGSNAARRTREDGVQHNNTCLLRCLRRHCYQVSDNCTSLLRTAFLHSHLRVIFSWFCKYEKRLNCSVLIESSKYFPTNNLLGELYLRNFCFDIKRYNGHPCQAIDSYCTPNRKNRHCKEVQDFHLMECTKEVLGVCEEYIKRYAAECDENDKTTCEQLENLLIFIRDVGLSKNETFSLDDRFTDLLPFCSDLYAYGFEKRATICNYTLKVFADFKDELLERNCPRSWPRRDNSTRSMQYIAERYEKNEKYRKDACRILTYVPPKEPEKHESNMLLIIVAIVTMFCLPLLFAFIVLLYMKFSRRGRELSENCRPTIVLPGNDVGHSPECNITPLTISESIKLDVFVIKAILQEPIGYPICFVEENQDPKNGLAFVVNLAAACAYRDPHREGDEQDLYETDFSSAKDKQNEATEATNATNATTTASTTKCTSVQLSVKDPSKTSKKKKKVKSEKESGDTSTKIDLSTKAPSTTCSVIAASTKVSCTGDASTVISNKKAKLVSSKGSVKTGPKKRKEKTTEVARVIDRKTPEYEATTLDSKRSVAGKDSMNKDSSKNVKKQREVESKRSATTVDMTKDNKGSIQSPNATDGAKIKEQKPEVSAADTPTGTPLGQASIEPGCPILTIPPLMGKDRFSVIIAHNADGAFVFVEGRLLITTSRIGKVPCKLTIDHPDKSAIVLRHYELVMKDEECPVVQLVNGGTFHLAILARSEPGERRVCAKLVTSDFGTRGIVLAHVGVNGEGKYYITSHLRNNKKLRTKHTSSRFDWNGFMFIIFIRNNDLLQVFAGSAANHAFIGSVLLPRFLRKMRTFEVRMETSETNVDIYFPKEPPETKRDNNEDEVNVEIKDQNQNVPEKFLIHLIKKRN